MRNKLLWTAVPAAALLSGSAAMATIDNTATVSASYGAQEVTAEDTVRVTVSPAAPDLGIEKTAGSPTTENGAKSDRVDAGDTITYTITIENLGNVTLENVTPVDPGPQFNGEDGTGTMGGFIVSGSDPEAATATLAPGESATFTAVYTLSDLDVYLAADVTDGVTNTATSTGDTSGGESYDDTDEATGTTALPYVAEIDLVKEADLDDTNENGFADLGETITYTYSVTNTGNVPLTGISVSDVHEGATLSAGTDIVSETLVSDGPLATGPTTATSTDDATPGNGIWGVLQPEAVVRFTYTHTVTQTEIDGG